MKSDLVTHGFNQSCLEKLQGQRLYNFSDDLSCCLTIVMVKKGFPEIKMRGSDCIQDLCPSYSCHAPPCGVWVLLLVPPFWYRKGCCQVPPQPLLTGQVFHLSSHPGGPGSSLQPGHNILNAFSQVLSELTSLLCSHSSGCC